MKFINSLALTVIALCLIKISFWDSLIGIKPNARPAAANSSEGNMFSSFKVGEHVEIVVGNQTKKGILKEINRDSIALWAYPFPEGSPPKYFSVLNTSHISQIEYD